MADGTEQISQTCDSSQNGVISLLEEASHVSRGVFESIQALAGTTYCKGVQINELRKFAQRNGCWITEPSTLGTFSDRGSENEVYLAYNNLEVIKLNDFRYADENLNSFFERMDAHNYYFPDCAYTLLGFAENREGKFCAVLSQHFIHSVREATIEEITTVLIKMGFQPYLGGEYFSNGTHDIFDALPNNVLLGIDGELYFIDTIIYRSDEGNNHLYRSLSPRFAALK